MPFSLGISEIFGVFFILAFWCLMFLALRGVMCWYWKINEIVQLLEMINRKLPAASERAGGLD